ncbi:transcriptional regulator, TetR family [Clostridium amylolyticum]|uniref:Transcriptional regulator, TetR family n=1 Tax=Clostridium amylolyticum TaxID=1121298 RepID=A0A1M6BU11_9CLOT|nr:TetR/AcrR family transcriptional regulator [Clostridium amylolyticum]SHI52083.1 transcriptional regulator, TetR family [Clostridium amylolyticum]
MAETKREKYLEQRKLLMEERKKEVIDTAKKLFLEKGLNNVTMNDIMNEAGLSKATMYRYYDSIHPIAFEVEYEMMQEIFSDLKLIDITNRNGGEAIKEILLTMVDRFIYHIKAYRYISMFDFLYADQYPNDNLLQEYNKVIQSIIDANMSGERVKEQYAEALTYVSVIFAYLQKLAHRKEIIDKGEIDVIERLNIVRKMIHKLLK